MQSHLEDLAGIARTHRCITVGWERETQIELKHAMMELLDTNELELHIYTTKAKLAYQLLSREAIVLIFQARPPGQAGTDSTGQR